MSSHCLAGPSHEYLVWHSFGKVETTSTANQDLENSRNYGNFHNYDTLIMICFKAVEDVSRQSSSQTQLSFQVSSDFCENLLAGLFQDKASNIELFLGSFPL